MARSAKLKVYRTAIGFHDAYVAASSQKSALAAWGSGKDLFARGAAEIVTDPALTKEPLASPGKIVKRLRGSADEQMAALPPDRPRPNAAGEAPGKNSDRPRRAATPVSKKQPMSSPPPSRSKVAAAELAIETFEADAKEKLGDLTRREAALTKERKKLIAECDAKRTKLSGQLDRETNAYELAVQKWRRS